jgi:hypothetical protein
MKSRRPLFQLYQSMTGRTTARIPAISDSTQTLKIWAIHFSCFSGIIASCLVTQTVITGWIGIAFVISGIFISIEGLIGVEQVFGGVLNQEIHS